MLKNCISKLHNLCYFIIADYIYIYIYIYIIRIYIWSTCPHIKVPLIFWFLIMILYLCFYHQLWVKWVCMDIENILDILEKLIDDFQNICGCLTLNEMHIKLKSLIICLIYDKLTNTSLTPPPEWKKNSIVHSTFNNFVYLNRNFHLLET